MSPNSIVNWFVAMCAELGLEGCSSHSGRRSFITKAARKVAQGLAAACAMFSSSLAIARSRRRSATSMVTLRLSAGWCH